MKNLIVLFGGKSAEHDISLITANLVLNALDEEKYNIFPVFVDGENHWFYAKNYKNNIKDFKKQEIFLKMGENSLFLKTVFGLKKFITVDCALLCHHGLNGEDGTIQGILELCNIPYTSSKVLQSAITMDKITMKLLLEKFEFNVVPYHFFSMREYDKNSEEILEKLIRKLGFPLIVKPSNLGSSIGISLAGNIEELKQAIDVAKKFDNKILVEKALENFKEINCACLAKKDSIIISSLEEPISYSKFLNFDEKYLKNINKTNLKRIYPAEISSTIQKEIQQTSEDIFKNFDLSGVVRIDYLVFDGIVYVNEINSIPGSLAYYLFENENLSFGEVLDLIVENAFDTYYEKQKLTFAFESTVLSQKDFCKK